VAALRPLRGPARRVVTAAFGAVALATLLLGGGSAQADHPGGRTEEREISWGLGRPAATQHDGRVLTISLISGFCLGERRPVAGKASVVELPTDAAHPHPRTIITAHVIAPVPHETERGEACADLGLSIPKRVNLKRPIPGTVFLDGYYDPPRPVHPGGP
jgi:hypothetical protein